LLNLPAAQCDMLDISSASHLHQPAAGAAFGAEPATAKTIGRTGRSLIRQSIADRKAILLFYQEAERDSFIRHDRYLKRVLRPLYNLTHRRRKKTGFRVAFDLLVRALRQQGFTVRINDYATARRYPDYPVGLIGYPCLLDRWKLPNPAVLGSALYDHPMLAPRLMDDERFRIYLVASQWYHDLFRPYYGERCVQWYAGLDIEQWPDTSGYAKDIDFLVYDKIRWDYDQVRAQLLDPIRQRLTERGFRIADIRYLKHDHAGYRQLLARSRAMLFVCEHETQGLAYQEAMAANVPILAWDNGYWRDPIARQFGEQKVPASSVPFFAADCGERFADFDSFEPALDRFIARLPSLKPRQYVRQHLSLRQSADSYAKYYFSLLNS
jgi:glycosyltransferase involved in cell wall biosynthesis